MKLRKRIEVITSKIKKLLVTRGFLLAILKLAQLSLKRINTSIINSNKIKFVKFKNVQNYDVIYRDVNNFLSFGLFRNPADLKINLNALPSIEKEKIMGEAHRIINNKFYIYYGIELDYGSSKFSWLTDIFTKYDWPNGYNIEEFCHSKPDGTDIKNVWELARFQFLSTIGYAYLLSGNKKYKNFVLDKIYLWIEENQFSKGPHWTCPMEVAIRLLNFITFLPIFGFNSIKDLNFIEKLSMCLIEHLFFIRENLEYSVLKENNHYLSNIVGLLSAKALFPNEKLGY